MEADMYFRLQSRSLQRGNNSKGWILSKDSVEYHSEFEAWYKKKKKITLWSELSGTLQYFNKLPYYHVLY